MAAAAQLTAGAVAAIAEQPDGTGTLEPVLQVVDLRMVSNGGKNHPSAERFRMVLSDGVYTLHAMLTTAESPRARDGSIQMGSIIRLREFICNTFVNRRHIIVVKLDILQSEHEIIGNSKPFEMKNVRKEQRSGTTTSVKQGMLEEIPCQMVSEITNVLGYLAKPVLFTVRATLSIVNIESLCYAACPLVVNGNQCDGAVISNGYEWWNCDGCNMTFVDCDYKYKIFILLADSKGDEIYATSSQEVGEELFGRTARELYFMKYEKQDHAKYNKIVMGAQNYEYLFDIKLNREAFSDESDTLPMFTIVTVKSLNPLAENSPDLERRNSVGMGTGFSDSETQLRQLVQIFGTGNVIKAAGVRVQHLLSEETDSNNL